jgi:hypothetical protein
MLERAREHPSDGIEYRLLDAAQPDQLAALSTDGFDAVVCKMALMDMADVGPLAGALRGLLLASGRFVFSTCHPCFNTLNVRFVHEVEEPGGEPVERRGVQITRYVTPAVGEGTAIVGQPVKQLYFDRPWACYWSPSSPAAWHSTASRSRPSRPDLRREGCTGTACRRSHRCWWEGCVRL